MTTKRKRNPINDAQVANRLKVEPKTAAQKRFLEALKQNQQVFATGPAGTGKTYLATMYACEMYLRGVVDKIIISRPAVPAQGENYGFLPGGIDSKLAPWMVPVVEVIEEALGSKQKYLEAQKAGDIEIAPFGFMRGRTFRNAFVIVDEAQNTTPEQMELLVTRMGEGSQLVVSGDLRQSDIRGISGLDVAVQLIKKHNIPCGLVEFNAGDVIRSDLCRMWVQAFEMK